MKTPNDDLRTSQGAGIVIANDSEAVLVQLNYGKAKGQWILPGGMVANNEHPHMAALREAKEETGLEVTVSGLLGIRHRLEKSDQGNVYWVYWGALQQKPSLVWPQNEIMEARYWNIQDAITETTVRPMTRLFLKTFLEKKSHLSQRDLPADHHADDTVWLI